MPTYKELIELLLDGQDVSASTFNTVLSKLAGNTSYLKSIFEAAVLGSAYFARDATVDSGTVVGNPVYYDAANQRFAKGLATATIDNQTGAVLTADSAQVWGVVFHKHNSTKADILLGGYAALDLSAVVDGDVTAGLYYLSGSSAGRLVKQRPPVSVPVLHADGEGNVFVNTRMADFFTNHVHHRYALVCRPAGTHTPPDLDERHEITDADDSLEGWLPADHAVFEGRAPYGAAFGYNLSASVLNNIWPPIPTSAAELIWDKGELKDDMGMSVPLGADGLAVIDVNGIWWMSDCYGDVPWPTLLDTAEDTEGSSSLSLECPRELDMRLTLWFTRMSFQTSGNVVTSLQTSEDSLLSITCVEDGTPATTGNLLIDLNLELVLAAASDTPGHIVLKGLEDNEFTRGPVVEAIQVNGTQLLASSTAQNGDNHQGIVTLSLLSNVLGRELPIDEIRLTNATEEGRKDVLAIGLNEGQDAEFRTRFTVPFELGAETLTLKIRFRFLARAAGDLPDLELTYRRLPRPISGALPLPLTDTSLAIDMSTGAAMSEDLYIEIDSDEFEVEPGDVVFYTLRRNGEDGDGYDGDVHVLDHRPIIIAAS